ncbi:MAG: glycosyltransferase family 2 protein [Candidatus Schekmanbacteria bacterium]|nr:glycosyltransferase family 2 protein [Candidatus Schekmanbacteria bacterium]
MVALSRYTTIVIVARNAAATIARAVRSALAQRPASILVVDDQSSDGTAVCARDAGGDAVSCAVVPQHVGLGHARRFALRHVTSPFLAWLDADDELLEGRIERLVAELSERGCDLMFDAAALHDGATGVLVRNLPVPAFMLEPDGPLRLFERNYLPGLAWPVVRTDLARRVGYDPCLATADDIDFALRALRAGARVGVSAAIGYRQYALANSLSRDLTLQRSCLRQALAKHAYADVHEFLLGHGMARDRVSWTLCSMALFRGEYEQAMAFLDAVLGGNGLEDLDLGFVRGTILLLSADLAGARRALAVARARASKPECLNNLGVALRLGHEESAAQDCFAEALRRFPGYVDAARNLRNPAAAHITTHPLRAHPSRSEYDLGEPRLAPSPAPGAASPPWMPSSACL